MFKVITAIATEPVSTAEAKLQCRVDVTDDDTLIAALITAAREFAEHYTGRAFAAQTLEMALPCFPDDTGSIDLDMPPVATITSIKYTDTAGVEQTVSTANYTLSTYGESRRINPAYLTPWPLTQSIPDAVRIRYVTGYTTLPKAAKDAILLIVGHLYQNRSAVGDVKLEEVPMGALALLNTIKIWSK
jgi:uncharacterized phiE125 gp8 family phage protein